MNAEALYRLWRRVLREDALALAARAPDFAARAGNFGLSAEEAEAAMALLRNPDAAYWPIQGYRFRLWENTVQVLRGVAPLTASVLSALGHDVGQLVRRFLPATGWRDHGPYMMRACLELLSFLAADEAVVSTAGVSDIIALDIATVTLQKRLSTQAPAAWMPPPTPPILADEGSYERVPNAIAVRLAHDVLPWLEAPEEAASTPLQPGPRHLLVWLPSVAQMPEYALLSDTAYQLYESMSSPLSLARAIASVADADAEERVRSALQRLLNIGVIRPVGPAAGASAKEESAAVIYGQHWDAVALLRGSNPSACSELLVDTLAVACGELQGMRVLDVGTGGGHPALRFAQRGAQVLGIDVAERSVEIARDYVQRAGAEAAGRISFEVMDATRMSLPDASFDVVTCLKTLWCLPQIDAGLGEMRRVLRPGGRLVVQIWGEPEQCSLITTGSSNVSRFLDDLSLPEGHVRPFQLTREQVEDLLVQVGFARQRITCTRHGCRVLVASVAEYWDILRTVAGTAYFNYARQTQVVRNAIDEQWRMTTASQRDASGAVPLALEWLLLSADKEYGAA